MSFRFSHQSLGKFCQGCQGTSRRALNRDLPAQVHRGDKEALVEQKVDFSRIINPTNIAKMEVNQLVNPCESKSKCVWWCLMEYCFSAFLLVKSPIPRISGDLHAKWRKSSISGQTAAFHLASCSCQSDMMQNDPICCQNRPPIGVLLHIWTSIDINSFTMFHPL